MKRYHVKDGGWGYEAENGLWVDYDEAHAIEQERDALRVKLVELPRPKGRGFLLHRGQFHSNASQHLSQSFPLHGLRPLFPRPLC